MNCTFRRVTMMECKLYLCKMRNNNQPNKNETRGVREGQPVQSSSEKRTENEAESVVRRNINVILPTQEGLWNHLFAGMATMPDDRVLISTLTMPLASRELEPLSAQFKTFNLKQWWQLYKAGN